MLEEYYLDKIQVSQDISAIEGFYVNEGYWNAHCEARYSFSPDPPNSKEVIIEILVQEKERFHLDSLEWEGCNHFSIEELEKISGFNKGMVLQPSSMQQISSSLKDFYRLHGYARVEISTELKENTKEEKRCGFHAIVRIKEGKIHSIRSISLSGNELTLDEVVQRQLTFREKDRYDASQILMSRQAIQDTGLFLTVESDEKFVGDTEADIHFTLKERNNKTLTFRLGYETSYGVLGGVEFEHINIFGTGRKFLASVGSTLFSSELSKSEAKIQFLEPQLWGSKTWSSRLEFSILMEDTPTFTVFEKGGGLFFEKKLSQFLTMELGYGLLFSEILEVTEEEEEKEIGMTIFSYFSQKFTLNLRNEEGYPTSGSYHSIEFQESSDFWGADVNYIRFYAHTAWYINLIERWVFSFSLRGGVIVPFGNSDSIPLQKRFFAGGASTLRSFKEKEMPPLDSKNAPVGGEGIFLASTELRIPIYGNFGFSTFMDAGQILPVVRKVKDYRVSHLKYAVGVSLWYNTPIGPIRFDMGFNPKREENPLTGQKEAMFAWFISIGFSY